MDADDPIIEAPPEKSVKRTDMRELGRLGGLKGGPARAAKLTPERKREIARLGGVARQYGKPKQGPAE